MVAKEGLEPPTTGIIGAGALPIELFGDKVRKEVFETPTPGAESRCSTIELLPD